MTDLTRTEHHLHKADDEPINERRLSAHSAFRLLAGVVMTTVQSMRAPPAVGIVATDAGRDGRVARHRRTDSNAAVEGTPTLRSYESSGCRQPKNRECLVTVGCDCRRACPVTG